jgi:polyhydroxyalkanoic acid inclusion protein PhaP
MAARTTTVKTESKNNEALHLVDALWDSWKSGLSMVYASQTELENQTLQLLERQQEAWAKTNGNLDKMEEEMKKSIAELRENVNQNIQNVSGKEAGKSFEEFNGRVDEIAGRMQQLLLTPNKANLTVLNQFQDQLHATLKQVIEQQQKTREETKTVLDDFFTQAKSAQKELIEKFEENTKNTIKLFSFNQ